MESMKPNSFFHLTWMCIFLNKIKEVVIQRNDEIRLRIIGLRIDATDIVRISLHFICSWMHRFSFLSKHLFVTKT
jgi:hypothetical protein